MGAEVYFWWMMMVTNNGGVAVVPIPYQTQEMCQWAGEQSGKFQACVPQPAADVAEFSATVAMGKPDVCEMDDGLTKRD